ncbi:hypothetical protein Gohar_002522 [Gossypium harknessii]|uniref:Uncharacterized protein n=1 Tax=Gossypium harknessii TaxID=34285 RepID=A0A7J9HL50_9ROSI|nr:hypothetical protein [Gossypium harknessii]
MASERNSALQIFAKIPEKVATFVEIARVSNFSIMTV